MPRLETPRGPAQYCFAPAVTRWILGLGVAVSLAVPPASAQVAAAAARKASEAAAASTTATPPAPNVRAEFADPIEAAQTLFREGKLAEAQAKLAVAAAVAQLTPFETMVLERTRAALAQRQGQSAVVISSLEAAMATGQVAKADEPSVIEALVGVSAKEKDHPRVLKWAQRYIDIQGPNENVPLMRIQSQLATGDERGALAALSSRIGASDAAGRAVPEAQVRLQWQLQRRLSDAAAEATLERLATRFSKQEYWAALVAPVAQRAGDNDRILIEAFRVLRATGGLSDADAREGMVETALRLGQPGEALAVAEEGVAKGLYPKGPRASNQQKLLDQARKAAQLDQADRKAAEAAALKASSGEALVDLGWAEVAALPVGAPAGSAQRGLALIEQGVSRGGLKRPIEAQMHLGVAQWLVGRKDAARATLRATLELAQSAKDPMLDAVRLWHLFASAATTP